MCYSASASFVTSTILFPVGLITATIAFRRDKHYFLLGLTSIFFAFQQFLEGMVWVSLNHHRPNQAHLYALGYLFFAYAFWPAYLSISVYMIETMNTRLKVMLGFIIASFIGSGLIYLPILSGEITFDVSILKHSILYNVKACADTIHQYFLLYIITLIVPLLISSVNKIKFLGIMIFISLLVSYVWYFYAFTSIWCFLGAILTTYILYIVLTLPIKNHKK